MPEARPPRRTPMPDRIAAWRRGIIVGSLGLFVAAWLAVAGLGKQASSTAAKTKAANQDQSSQTDSYGSDDSFGYDDGSSSSDSSGSSQSGDMSGATTNQS